jgi:hypothetical protein
MEHIGTIMPAIERISTERLEQLSSLLGAMSNRNKAPSDGLGIYLGDGIPRAASLGDLRSLELKMAVDELLAVRRKLVEELKLLASESL